VRPVGTAGRPVTGFARPGTGGGRPGTSAARGATAGPGAAAAALRGVGGAKPGTAARPVTTSGRFVRLGTASLAAEPGGPFINADRLDLVKYAARPNLARCARGCWYWILIGTVPGSAYKQQCDSGRQGEAMQEHGNYQPTPPPRVLCDYIVYVDRNMRRALDLAAAATQVGRPLRHRQCDGPAVSALVCQIQLMCFHCPWRACRRLASDSVVKTPQVCGYEDWWWKARLGKAYYQLGLLRDAEQQLASSLKNQDMVATALELAKVHVRLDQPAAALDLYVEAAGRQAWEPGLLLGAARVRDALGQGEEALALYQQVGSGRAGWRAAG
jgi:tetratricopeptide repeat protein 8